MKFVTALLLFFCSASQASTFGLQLANTYHDSIDLKNYWVSEKYDGVRADVFVPLVLELNRE